MNRIPLFSWTVICLGLASTTFAQTGPYDPETWPPTINPNLAVHYVVTDGGLTSPGGSWQEGLVILTGGDQVTTDFAIGGHTGKKATSVQLNIADSQYAEWADDEFIDILVQAYGDDGLFGPGGVPRNFEFLTGCLPELNSPVGGQVPVEAKNKRWNWILFRIPNALRQDGTRFVGSVPAGAQGDTSAGGVNGGTIRFQTVTGLIVRVVAFGAQGAFGEPADINKFFPPESCDPEPETNLVGLDLGTQTTNYMVILGGHDHTATVVNDVGPAADKRRAVMPDAVYLNFGIVSNYLGKACNDPRSVKVCLDIYDDPAFAGMNVRFGPEAYATDDKGGVAIYPPDKRQLMQGTGQWLRRSWTVPAVCLKGINADEYTAGPRFASENGQVAVSRIDLAVLRVGDHPLAGQDPLATCYEDPNICTDAYGNFVELDLVNNVSNGLSLGTSSGDQEMIMEEAGPVTDRRMAIRPAHDDGTPGFSHQYLNFGITDQALGPSSQPNAHLAICVTYYDDPALAGTSFKPEVYYSERNGLDVIVGTPASFFVTLQGSNQWRQAYWEISDMKFNGVNQGPQAAARFTTQDYTNGPVQAKIAFTRVRYGVIRPCGPLTGVNPLETCKPVVSLTITQSGTDAKLSWPATTEGFTLESSTNIAAVQWDVPAVTVEAVNGTNVVTLPIGPSTQFFRLRK